MAQLDKKKDYGTLFIPGGCLLGLGIGMAIGPYYTAPGVLAGLGTGFIIWGIIRTIQK